VPERMSPWKATREAALTGPAAVVQSLACPKCGAALSIRFDPVSPQPDGGTAGFLIIRCLGCAGGSAADGLRETPPWVPSLGPVIETRPRAS
jgi:hypothetical protein